MALVGGYAFVLDVKAVGCATATFHRAASFGGAGRSSLYAISVSGRVGFQRQKMPGPGPPPVEEPVVRHQVDASHRAIILQPLDPGTRIVYES